MEDQMGDFPRGGGYPWTSMSSPKFDFPTLSSDVVDNNPILIYFKPKNNFI